MKRTARSVMCVSAVASLLVAGCMPSGDPEADAGPLLDAPAFDSALDANRFDGHVGDTQIGADTSGMEDVAHDGSTGGDGGVPTDVGEPIDGSESMMDAADRTDVGTDGGAMMDARAPIDCAAATVHSCDVPSTVDGASSVGSCGAAGNCEYTCRGGSFVVTRNTCDVPTATFGVTRTIETWTVPTTGSYFISATGGRGGTGGNTIRTGGGEAGGYPVRAEGTFELVRGQVLRIAVGEDGSPGLIFTPGGGGGASFVVLESGMPLVVAGGGGGGGFGDAPVAQQGLDASSATNGTAANCGGSASAPGGTDGHGGGAVSGSDSSGAGGGLLTAGDGCGGGQAFVDGAAGGFCSARAGGFGGGGGGGGGGAGGGGGGGGYSGGGGGSLASVSCGGGGGGSFVAPSATSASITVRGGITSGVTIRFLRPDRIDFAETGSMASWVVPESGVYVIHGRGGSTELGRAADAVGAFALSAGDTLDILVGDLGYGGGGAGGTFVVRRAAEPIPLVVAGGAGGGRGVFSPDASLTTSGNPGQPGDRAGGSDGAGGLSELPVGYGGGGFVTDGAGGFGGRSFLNGGLGGAGAGFGGGGGCVMFSGAGGGGGYSGGGGGRDTGGGGGSYVSSVGVGAEITLAAPLRAQGFVTILLP